MRIQIKGMVCNHCVEAVANAFAAAGIPGAEVSLGGADLPGNEPTPQQLQQLDTELHKRGFQRITEPSVLMVEKAKLLIMQHVRQGDCRLNLSACLQHDLHTDYSAISKAFSAIEGRTIEKYAIAQRVEYVKELLSYGEMTISEIADRTGYSSVAHLSRQFKSVTGLTPSEYLRTPTPRTPLNLI